MTHHDVFSQEQIDKINELKKDTSDAGREALQNYVLEILIEWYTPEGQPPPEPIPEPGPTDPTLPADGRLQPEKGASKDANGWDAVVMKDDATKWKVVDEQGINVADLFDSEATAKQFIAYYKWQQDNQNPPPEPVPVPDPTPGTSGATPYPAKGAAMQSTQRGPTERHYASGKPDDNTVEKNTKNIKFKNYQCVVDITNDCEWSHDDAFSIKLGGSHMNGGWFDNSLSVYDGKTGLGTEKKHPSTQLYIVKGPTVGDTRGKRFKLACTYFTDENKVELWTDFGDGWKKQVEGKDVGGFNPKTPEDEFQLRIDGFKTKNKPPTIHSAVVTEI